MKKALLYGIVGSFFFAFTFVLNRSMSLAGGYWLWSAVLRYGFTLPILFLLLLRGKKFLPVLREIRRAPGAWLLWSTVGFGLFYAPMSAASVYAESWFTCAVWQFTIVAGVLLTPLFGKKIPMKNLACGMVIVAGIVLMQVQNFRSGAASGMAAAFALIALGAFCYPLGNRKMMQHCTGLTTLQRVFGMTLCSMPFWGICGVIACCNAGLPSGGQCMQSFLVALFSGVVATVLFFQATDLVKHDPKKLAVIEATQSGEVIFTLLLGVLFLHDAAPTSIALLGIALILTGMTANSLLTGK